MDTVPHLHARAQPGASLARRPMAGSPDLIPVILFEDTRGRLVVVDSRLPPSRPLDGQLVRIGRTRLALRHLASTVATQLLGEGAVTVEGADALNVLLAFANGLTPGTGDR
jgi:hypothetical protein